MNRYHSLNLNGVMFHGGTSIKDRNSVTLDYNKAIVSDRNAGYKPIDSIITKNDEPIIETSYQEIPTGINNILNVGPLHLDWGLAGPQLRYGDIKYKQIGNYKIDTRTLYQLAATVLTWGGLSMMDYINSSEIQAAVNAEIEQMVQNQLNQNPNPYQLLQSPTNSSQSLVESNNFNLSDISIEEQLIADPQRRLPGESVSNWLERRKIWWENDVLARRRDLGIPEYQQRARNYLPRTKGEPLSYWMQRNGLQSFQN